MFLVMLCLLVTLTPSLQRTYDIEEESFKRIGADLNGTIARFRKSREYAKILQDKLQEVITMIKDTALYAQFFYNAEYKKEAEKIAEALPKFIEKLINSQDEKSQVEQLDFYYERSNRVPVQVKNEAKVAGLQYTWKIVDDCIASLKADPAANRLERSGQEALSSSSEDDQKNIGF